MNRRLLAAIAIFGLMTAACELRADLRLELNADESGNVLVTLGLDEEFQSLVEESGEPIEDSFFGQDNPFGELPGAAERTYEADGFTYYEAKVPFSDLNGLALLGTDADNPLNDFDIVFSDETARVSGSIDIGEVTGGDLADDQLAGISAESLAEIFQFHIQVLMPGEVTSQNADRQLNDGTLEWDIPLIGGVDTLTIEAESNLTSSGGVSAWVIVLVALIVVGLIVFMMTRSRSGTGPTAPPQQAAAAEPATAPVTPADAPPVTELPPEPPTPEG
jgi:hypothetical protein